MITVISLNPPTIVGGTTICFDFALSTDSAEISLTPDVRIPRRTYETLAYSSAICRRKKIEYLVSRERIATV
ncbi:hypothetical protein V1477_010759 [Vespula maculifrons]|uniref:Uncharacterized protein n=1 Tax=Vespula maculifrons TaxID=7453 RepID=A0ABD2C2Y5_VESMC